MKNLRDDLPAWGLLVGVMTTAILVASGVYYFLHEYV